MNGKGDKPRPLAVPYSRYADNYDQINWSTKPVKKQSKKDILMAATEQSQILEGSEDYLKDKEASSLINPSNSTE